MHRNQRPESAAGHLKRRDGLSDTSQLVPTEDEACLTALQTRGRRHSFLVILVHCPEPDQRAGIYCNGHCRQDHHSHPKPPHIMEEGRKGINPLLPHAAAPAENGTWGRQREHGLLYSCPISDQTIQWHVRSGTSQAQDDINPVTTRHKSPCQHHKAHFQHRHMDHQADHCVAWRAHQTVPDPGGDGVGDG